MKISSRKASLMTIGITALLFVVLLFILLRFYKSIQTVSQLATDVQTARSSENSREKMKRVFAASKGDVTLIEKSFFDKFSAVTFMGELESYAELFGLTFNPSQIIEVNEKGKQPAVLLSFETKGGETATKNFISLVENMPYAYRVESVSLFKNEADGVEIQQGEFQLRLYLSTEE